jgi:FG-GAP-like repeat
MNTLRVRLTWRILAGAATIAFSCAALAQQFQEPVNYHVNPGPTGVVIGDFNGDRHLDLVATTCGDKNCSLPGSVTVLLGNGKGRFKKSGIFVAGPDFTSADTLASGDFNRDNTPDLIVVNNGINQFGTVSVLLADGMGGFEPPVSYSVGGSTPVWAAVADFNRDHNPDIAISVTTTDSVAVLLGNGDGTFQPAINYPVGGGPQGITTGDIDGDGNPDIVSADQCGDDPGCRAGTVSVLLGNGDGTFQPRIVSPEGLFPLSVAVADFNGDAQADLAVANPCGTDLTCVSHGGVGVLLGKGDGTFQPVIVYPATGFDTARLNLGDFNRDGIPDVVAMNVQGSSITLLLGNSDGTLQSGADYVVGQTPIAAAIGRFNKDRAPDLAIADQSSEEISVLLNTGATLQSESPAAGAGQ